jgi:NADPH2:quinone reductase
MKAIRVRSVGGPENLKYEDAPDPSPGPGQVVFRVEAAGINFIEVYQRVGLYKVPLPAIPGGEAAGTVIAVGPGVTDLKVGDEIATYQALGAYAERALVAADRCIVIPHGLNARFAAAAMLQGMTAHYLACTTHSLQAGETCLIHAAAGGVGLLLVQIAKLRGARVIGTVSSAEKERLAREAGADEVIRYTEQDFVPEVKRMTGGAGVAVVYDSVGRTTFDGSLACLKPRGMMALFGQSSGPVPPLDPQILNGRGSLFLTRPKLQDYTATRADFMQRAGDVVGWVSEGKLKVRIWRDFPLQHADDAHRALESRITTGKLLLVPGAGA